MKIAFLGAGSVVFAKNHMSDLLSIESIREQPLEFALNDIDPDRLMAAKQMAKNLGACFGAKALRITASRNRRRILDGADFVICMINVGGFKATLDDLTIPRQFGLRQTIGDTLGVGGIFRAARSAAVILDICKDIRELCPDALLINYANPMAMICLLIQRAFPDIKLVGLCHGLEITKTRMKFMIETMNSGPDWFIRHLAGRNEKKKYDEWQEVIRQLDEKKEYSFHCAGINHMAFFLEFKKHDIDLYPQLMTVQEHPELFNHDRVRLELMLRLGFYMTESTPHTAEYLPFFMRHPAEIKKMRLKENLYLDTCRAQQEEYDAFTAQLDSNTPLVDAANYRRSQEYAARIIWAVSENKSFAFNGSVPNANKTHRLIENLPADCCVEVPCTVKHGGITPRKVGRLPPQCAAMIQTNVNVQDLTVRGLLEEDSSSLRHALMFDPNTGSSLTLHQIDQLCHEMLKAHKRFLSPGLRRPLLYTPHP